MKKPFKLLRELSHEVAETIGVSLDKPCILTSEAYSGDGYVFTFYCGDSKLKLDIPDVEEYFYGLP